MSKYPILSGRRRPPDMFKDGKRNYGKPCIICGTGTCGEKWVQVSWFRGDDETVRVCAEHWKDEAAIIEALKEKARES